MIVKKFGDKNLSLTKLQNTGTIRLDNLLIPSQNVVWMEQVHSDLVRIVSAENYGTIPLPGTDGMITTAKNVFLAIKTADCIPVFIWDEKREIVAALHSGRTGTLLNITGKAVTIMQTEFGCQPSELQVELGPAICEKCYELDRRNFADFVAKTGIGQNFPFLDLKKVVKAKLLEKGVCQITDQNICTKENPAYFSYRRNGTDQRQISLIGMI
ncbi:MAG TPA: peptidoglycan editing factor PgeF [Candidatus Cloacimonadota bacterium]|nr:peptidoglycan editing factor PgeF [Candidatus Cloacimonadota bacterium]